MVGPRYARQRTHSLGTLSLSRIVCSRCAMASTVDCANAARMHACILASVAWSTLAVLSSIICRWVWWACERRTRSQGWGRHNKPSPHAPELAGCAARTVPGTRAGVHRPKSWRRPHERRAATHQGAREWSLPCPLAQARSTAAGRRRSRGKSQGCRALRP